MGGTSGYDAPLSHNYLESSSFISFDVWAGGCIFVRGGGFRENGHMYTVFTEVVSVHLLRSSGLIVGTVECQLEPRSSGVVQYHRFGQKSNKPYA